LETDKIQLSETTGMETGLIPTVIDRLKGHTTPRLREIHPPVIMVMVPTEAMVLLIEAAADQAGAAAAAVIHADKGKI
jgi:hypothetical protein